MKLPNIHFTLHSYHDLTRRHHGILDHYYHSIFQLHIWGLDKLKSRNQRSLCHECSNFHRRSQERFCWQTSQKKNKGTWWFQREPWWSKGLVPKNDTVFPKQRYLKGIGKDRNGLRKNQKREGQLGSMMGRYSDQEVFTFSKGMKRD